jgi:uncharacterized protein (DUF488 family)
MTHLDSHALRIYTIGHSNRSFEEFVSLLEAFGIHTLADIRSFPSSKKFPHFNRANLEKALPVLGIEYLWIPKLGGRRRVVKGFDSPNTGLVSPGFRAYADYMDTERFREGVDELLSVARKSATAYMCAEGNFSISPVRVHAQRVLWSGTCSEEFCLKLRNGFSGIYARLWRAELWVIQVIGPSAASLDPGAMV